MEGCKENEAGVPGCRVYRVWSEGLGGIVKTATPRAHRQDGFAATATDHKKRVYELF
jgi:hypothetical protein